MAIKNEAAAELKEWLAAGDAVVIDVREADEWAAGHLAAAVHLPLSAIEAQHINAVDADDVAGRKVVFQCRSGVRSQRAAEIFLAENNDLEFYNLEGGIMAWVAAGFEVVE